MRIHVSHATTYTYEAAPSYFLQLLRMTPRSNGGQMVRRWAIGISHDTRLLASRDSFGNVTHTFSLAQPPDTLTITAEGTVETTDTAGVMSETGERFTPQFFLRETPLTTPGPDITAFSRDIAKGKDNLEKLHSLNTGLHGHMKFDTTPTQVATIAQEAFHQSSGVCQDYSHIMIAAARSLGIPARYVSGYFQRIDGVVEQDASHAWVEAYSGDGLGWVGFDPTNGVSTSDQHIRIACGLDYQDAAPSRGTHHGGSEEVMTVSLRVEKARKSAAR